MVRIGTAAWSVPREHAAPFPVAGSHLERYSAVLNAVEINSSFYRPHRTTTHERRLKDADDLLTRFLSEVSGLGLKLGPLLVQLPPSLRFEVGVADTFLSGLRRRVEGLLVCEPRHASWFTPDVERLLDELRIARVAADPAPVSGADKPGGWRSVSYYRLHGSPRIYYSAYTPEYLAAIAERIASDAAAAVETWCIFDNTAAFAATGDALTTRSLVLNRRLGSPSHHR
jgi:uncharacterized protein YecE (DUF72 family)